MATTYKADNKTIIDAITPATILDPGTVGGNVRVMTDYVAFATATGLPTTGDIIEVCGELPVGARVLDIMIWSNDATVTFTVGDYEDVDRYHAGTTANTLAHMAAIAGFNYEVDMTTTSTPDNQIILTAAGGTITTGKVIWFNVFYTVE